MSLIARGAKVVLSDIEPFSRHALRRPLRRYQVEPARAIMDSVLHRRGDTFAVMMSRQAGKNELSAQLEIYLLNLFQRVGGQIVKASPTFKPQTVNSIKRIEERLKGGWNAGQWHSEEGYIIALGRANAMFLSAGPKANVVGATASLLLEGDEAQDIAPDRWNGAFSPMAASTNATRVLWGTAWTSRTLLANTIRTCRQAEQRDGRRRVFVVPWEQVAAEVPAYSEFARSERDRLGDGHPLFRTQYKLEEIDDSAGLFPRARQALMHGSHTRQRQPTPGHTYAILVDVAGEEEDVVPGGSSRAESPKRDATALTVVDVDLATVADPYIAKPSYRTVDRRLWIGEKIQRLYQVLVGLVAHWSARWVIVDATGLGAGLFSFLSARFGADMVLPCVFNATTKTAVGWDFVAIVETGRYQDYVDDDEPETRQFWYEVEACAFEAAGAGALRWGVWEAPSYDGQVAKGHDDCLLSAALVAILDGMTWGIGDSAVVPAPDPLENDSTW